MAAPPETQDHIDCCGGKLISVEMGLHQGEPFTLVRPIFTFPDFEAHYETAMEGVSD